MIKKEKNGLTWFEFELFQQFPEVNHAICSHKSEDGPLSFIYAHENHESKKRLFSTSWHT